MYQNNNLGLCPLFEVSCIGGSTVVRYVHVGHRWPMGEGVLLHEVRQGQKYNLREKLIKGKKYCIC